MSSVSCRSDKNCAREATISDSGVPGRMVCSQEPNESHTSAAEVTGAPQTHLRLLQRVPVRALGGEPLLPVLLRRDVLTVPAGVRPLLADAFAPADGTDGRGEVTCHRSFIQPQLESCWVVRRLARVEQRAIGGAGRGCAADRPLR